MADPRRDALAPAQRGPLPQQEPLTGGGVPSLYKLSDADLKKRAEDGGLDAEGALHDRVVVRGLVLNHPDYVQLWTWIATRFWLNIKKDNSHRVRIYLQLDESITIETIEVHWWKIRWWQRFLSELQGPEPYAEEGARKRQGKLPVSRQDSFPPPWLQLKRDNSKRIRIYLQMDETITVRRIKEHWGGIREWQGFLRESQGPEPHTTDGYLSLLNSLHGHGKSYSELARHVELQAIYWLDRYVKKMSGGLDEISLRDDEWSEDEAIHWEEECSAALNGFRILGCSRDEIRSWLKQALKHLTSNKAASIFCDGLVERQAIIDALKRFKNRGKKGLGVIQHKKT